MNKMKQDEEGLKWDLKLRALGYERESLISSVQIWNVNLSLETPSKLSSAELSRELASTGSAGASRRRVFLAVSFRLVL